LDTSLGGNQIPQEKRETVDLKREWPGLWSEKIKEKQADLRKGSEEKKKHETTTL